MLTICCWAWGLPLNVVYLPCETPLEKTNFSFANSCQLEITSWLGMGAVSSYPLSAGAPSGLTLCRLPQSVWVHVCVSPVVSGRHWLVSPIPSHSYTHPKSSLSPVGRALMKTCYLGTEYSKVSNSLYIFGLWASVLVPINYNRKPLWWWLRETMVCKAEKQSLVFSRFAALSSSLRLLATWAASGLGSI